MLTRTNLLVLSIGAGLVACAPAGTPVDSSVQPVRTDGVGTSGALSANIQSVQESRSDIRQSSRGRSYGSSTLTAASSNNLTNVNVVFTHNSSERFLSWAILAGACGSPAAPLLPSSSFPELQVGSGGRSEVTAALPIEFPASGTYHINIYRERNQSRESLIACGNYRRGRG